MIIVIAEVLFWVLVAAGMVVRHWLRMPILSKFLLLAVPLVDVALVIAVIAELRGGRPVGIEHQLVGLYLGIILILGPGIIRWCDEKAQSLSSRKSLVASAHNIQRKNAPNQLNATRIDLGCRVFRPWLAVALCGQRQTTKD